MKIFINHTPTDIPVGMTLAQLMEREGLSLQGIAVAVENKVIRRGDWGGFVLADGMNITVIKAVCGG